MSSLAASVSAGPGAWMPPAVSEAALLKAFADVFGVHDVVSDARAPILGQALRQLDQLGVPRGMLVLTGSNVTLNGTAFGGIGEDVLAGVLMRAALGNLLLGMRDPSDWTVVVADVSTGELVRRRSFSSVRLAVIESLLLIAIVALGRAVWIYKG